MVLLAIEKTNNDNKKYLNIFLPFTAFTMTHAEQPPCLYLEVCSQNEQLRLPLHSSIVLFLLSYCDCKSFRVFLVLSDGSSSEPLKSHLPASVSLSNVQVDELPKLVSSCRLPAALDESAQICRAGLAVVLRHIIDKSIEADPSRKDVAALLGFKKTCLKACAEVSKWTRLCEIGIPSAVEDHLHNPGDVGKQLPLPVLTLESRLAEPVKVHNDDKIRRQKLQEQKRREKLEPVGGQANKEPSPGRSPQVSDELELRAALAKLSVVSVPAVTTRENSEIRKVKTSELPPLEHVFAEGLYFTLTDVVLLPCIHQYLCSLQASAPSALQQLPNLLRWYNRVQEVPGVIRAAKDCGLHLSTLQVATTCPPWPSGHPSATLLEEEGSQETTTPLPFVGGPRPTMTKLKENGIEAIFASHPCPSWNLPWDSLPSAINPTEGKMSNIRAIRKMQQLNNLIAMVTDLARPGDTIVDFCSGTGHVGIVLAHTFPDCQVALHACGIATDMVLEHCIQAESAFVISPCCYGFIQNAVKFTFPKSEQFRKTLTYKEHMILCRFADQTAVQLPPERRLIGKQCMGLVDLDRSWAAEASGYSVQVITMEPESCSPKNNMLVGRPPQRRGC
uniref:Glutathione S-transferase, C-terminal domain containing n=1 Tax=Oryzias latipes TaxID=8090 RepID=A0A3P9JRA4_ORYLA